ncbi:hypothetical protein N3C_2942 [Clostridium sp. N3C]|uniref:DUF6514 family protein n=1 Tax=Clostridium sp. N3C TaxID=1776758 RepID=UPI00092DF81E|nr:DUF6514 family protein [Clostridium sp. N3C]NLZ34755.1 hypothetical protein [Clostridiales bacterium]SCN26637.1 hypothetical protein N3C_2942 [Clostridium sp. N3C]
MIVETLTRTENSGKLTYLYKYNLIEGKIFMEFNGGNQSIKSYGIEVERIDISHGKTVNIKNESIENISPQKEKVYKLLKMLHQHGVSPIHLVDVIGEYVDEWVRDFDLILEN